MYGASAQLVITMKGGSVNGFTLASILPVSLSHGILICQKGQRSRRIHNHPPQHENAQERAIYSVKEGNSLYWEQKTIDFFSSLKFPPKTAEGKDGKPYSGRYIGSMVADAYRTLLYGGLFAYPADKKSPKGKLRILYECAPMAMVMEQAGGQAVDSHMKRLLEVVPQGIHDRSGIYMGSYDEVEKVIAAHT